jgi:hypothetical protein
MAYPAILGRRFERPVINLGFSGNAKMEPEMAALLAELDPALFVLDSVPNMNAKEISERAAPFVKALRDRHPATPILVVEGRTYQTSFLNEEVSRDYAERKAAWRRAFDGLVAAGVGGLHFCAGEDQLGDDGEATVDGSHPTDLGFIRQSDAFQKCMEPILRAAPRR